MDIRDRDVLFRLLLLPLWIATYVAAGRTFHVYVNANTGKVIGERPYSAVKIASAVLAAIVTVVVAYVLYRNEPRLASTAGSPDRVSPRPRCRGSRRPGPWVRPSRRRRRPR